MSPAPFFVVCVVGIILATLGEIAHYSGERWLGVVFHALTVVLAFVAAGLAVYYAQSYS